MIPKAKLPLNCFNVLKTDSKGLLSFKDSVINNVITSVSVWDLNLKPFDSNFFLINLNFQ